jgi:hypothetical protein
MNYLPNQTIRPIRYMGEIRLRMGHAPLEIGTRIKMGNRPDTYEVTRIEPNGLCCGIDIDFLNVPWWRVREQNTITS